jgi:hypothetical protein
VALREVRECLESLGQLLGKVAVPAPNESISRIEIVLVKPDGQGRVLP